MKYYTAKFVNGSGEEWHEETFKAKSDRSAMIYVGQHFDDMTNRLNLYTAGGELIRKRNYGKWIAW